MKIISMMLFIILATTARADMDNALNALMDEDSIQYVSTRGSDEQPTLLIGLADDGTSRDGYAEYICIVLKDNNAANNVLIKVIDADIYSRQQEEKMLGSFICNHS